MSDNTSSSSSGIGFCGLLAIVFITLKLLGKIDWPWMWVVAPLWIPLAVVLTVMAVVGAAWVGASLIDEAVSARRKRIRETERNARLPR